MKIIEIIGLGMSLILGYLHNILVFYFIIWVQDFMYQIALNIYFETNVPKNLTRKKCELLTKMFQLYQVSKWQDIQKDCKWQNVWILSNRIHWKHDSIKIGSISFFFSFFFITWHAKIPPSIRIPRYWH